MPQNRTLPRKEQAAETRRKLIDTARTLFAENGYAATSVRQLHRAAELSDGILYHYFPEGKQELFHVIIEEELDQIVSSTSEKGQDYSGLPLEQVLEDVYRIWLELLKEHYEIFRIMFCEHEVKEVINAEELGRILADRQQWFPQLLQERTMAGEIRELDYEFTAEMVFSVMFDAMIVKVSNMGGGWIDSPAFRSSFFKALVDSWRNPQ